MAGSGGGESSGGIEKRGTLGRGGGISFFKALALHLLCAHGLAAGYWVASESFRLTLVSEPAATLRLLLLFEAPIVIGLYSLIRRDPHICPYWRASLRGILALPIGALINAFGAIVLGAPVSLKYCGGTIYWSCLMSLFTFVPAACVFGQSRTDWQTILGHPRPTEEVHCLVSLPAYGAVIGAWFGAWPMPLDWERPWQEWPICVTYGAVAGYLVGTVASLILVQVLKKQLPFKRD